MRRRDRFKELIWIKALPGDPAEGRVILATPGYQACDTSVETLTGGFGLLVEMEFRDGHYDVRCYPNPLRATIHMPRVSSSYTGKRLEGILAAAARDYEIYISDPDLAVLSPRETIRWVA